MTLLAFDAALNALDAASLDAIMLRRAAAESAQNAFGSEPATNIDVSARVADIIAQVASQGDVALTDMARRFDGVELSSLEVPMETCRAALDSLDLPLRRALERSARNIECVHRAMLPVAVETSPEPGVVIGRRPDALNRVGVYAPGGRAAYPSSVLMGVVPARVAGVREIILCSPPSRDGLPSRVVLAAAALAGVTRVFALGGAGAIAAMALGTASVPRVDRIVGPGNAFVAEAKLQLATRVAIDSPAGPSELLVLADDNVDPARVAQELIAQAEHDPDAAVVAVIFGSRSREAVRRIASAVEMQLAGEARADVARAALAARGALLWCEAASEAVQFANRWAPEHLLIACEDSATETMALRSITTAGTVFLGDSSSVAFGDYISGANHVLPTGGLARSYSGLSTLDFVRWTTWQRIDASAAMRFADDTQTLATAEGLPAHARAARGASEVRA